MGDQIETHRVQMYRDGIDLLAQQTMSRFRGKTRFEGGLKGKIDFFDQAGQTSMVLKTARHAPTDPVEAEMNRRRIVHDMYTTAHYVARDDIQDVMNDPTGTIGRMQAAAMARRTDQTVADAAFVTAYTGETGSTTVSHPSTHEVAAGAAGLTTTKIISAKRILDEYENDSRARYAMCTAEQLTTDLLANANYATSGDYNTVRALVNGEINTWVGFEFDRFEGLPKSGNDRSCCFWSRDSIVLAVRDVYTRVSELPEQHYDWQVYTSFEVGATRGDELGVVEVICTEA